MVLIVPSALDVMIAPGRANGKSSHTRHHDLC